MLSNGNTAHYEVYPHGINLIHILIGFQKSVLGLGLDFKSETQTELAISFPPQLGGERGVQAWPLLHCHTYPQLCVHRTKVYSP